MVVNDYGKLVLLVSILVAASVLGALHVIDSDTVKLILVGQLGYLTGNGVLARRGQAPSPVLVASHRRLTEDE